jgi:hypothetical protein
MTAQAPAVQGAVSKALSEQDIAFGADLWPRRSVSEAKIRLRYPEAFRRSSVSKRASVKRLHSLQNAALLDPVAALPTHCFPLRAPSGRAMMRV